MEKLFFLCCLKYCPPFLQIPLFFCPPKFTSCFYLLCFRHYTLSHKSDRPFFLFFLFCVEITPTKFASSVRPILYPLFLCLKVVLVAFRPPHPCVRCFTLSSFSSPPTILVAPRRPITVPSPSPPYLTVPLIVLPGRFCPFPKNSVRKKVPRPPVMYL